MISYDFHLSLAYWLGFVSRAIERALEEQLAPHGLGLQEVKILACLAMSHELSQSELGAMIGIEPSTLVRALDRMEKSGWVRRHPSARDRRRKLIRATEQAKPVWRKVVQEGEKIEKQAISGIGKSQLQQLQEAIRQMVRNLQGSTDLAGHKECDHGPSKSEPRRP